MLGRLMQNWPMCGLERVHAEPPGHFSYGTWWDGGPRGCLYGIAAAIPTARLQGRWGEGALPLLHRAGFHADQSYALIYRHGDLIRRSGPIQYDKLVKRFGQDRITRAVKARAHRLIVERMEPVALDLAPVQRGDSRGLIPAQSVPVSPAVV